MDDTQTSANANTDTDPLYSTMEQFVVYYLTSVYNRRIHHASRLWCSQWWKHAELCAKFSALWYAFEHLRLAGPEGMAKWFVQYADPIMEGLFNPNGPLRGCSEEHHRAVNEASDYRLPTCPYVSEHENKGEENG